MTAGNEDALGMPIAIINKPGAGWPRRLELVRDPSRG